LLSSPTAQSVTTFLHDRPVSQTQRPRIAPWVCARVGAFTLSAASASALPTGNREEDVGTQTNPTQADVHDVEVVTGTLNALNKHYLESVRASLSRRPPRGR
jgi:hypothetical protein